MRHRKEIDGLRAIAVIAVLLDHAKSPYFVGGFVGVDIFFVISGFLITFITINDIEKQRFSLWRFYDRRIRRIIPALLVVCSVATIASFLLLYPDSAQHYLRSLRATLLFVANFYFYFEADYFARSSERELLLHTWTLAVEEQFYILFPLLFLFFYRRKKAVLAVTTVLVVSLCLALSAGDRLAVFYLLPYRAWEFAFGALIALHRYKTQSFKIPPRYIEPVVILALTLLCASLVVTPEGSSPAHLIVPVAGTAVLILVGDKSKVCRFALANALMVYVGSISYSLYLWHQPIFAIARARAIGELTFVDYLPLLALALVLSHISYKLVETPFRNRQKMRLPKLPIAVVGLALPMAALWPLLNEGTTRSKLLSGDELGKYVNYSMASDRKTTWSAVEEYKPTDIQMKIAVVGNSHAKDMFNALRLSEAIDSIDFVPLISNRQCIMSRNDERLSWVLPRRVAIEALEDCHTKYPFLDPYMENIVGVIIAPLWSEKHVDDLPSVLNRIRDRGIPVLVAGNTAQFSDVPKMIRNLAMSGVTEVQELNRAVAETHLDESKLNDKIRNIAKYHESLFLDRASLVCPDTGCDLIYADGFMTVFDYGHWTLDGANLFAPRIYHSEPMQEFMGRVTRYSQLQD